MRHFDSTDEYEQLVETIANRERELAEDVPDAEMPDYSDGYEGYEHEYTIAQMVITAPYRVGDEVTMAINGEPYVDTRIKPTDVILRSPNADDINDQLIADNQIRRAAVQALAYDLHEELTPDD